MRVVITGASSGLGLALYRRFTESALHQVIGTSHDPEIIERSPHLIHFHANGSTHAITDFADRLYTEYLMGADKIDVLINNAGINAICPFLDLTPDFLRNIMQVNFETPVFLTQAFLPLMQRPGIVINVISDAAWRPMRHSLAYNCSKAALDMATKQMARELTKPHQLSIIGVRPGKMHGTKMSQYIDQRVQEVRGWTAEQATQYFQQNSLTGLESDPSLVAEFIHSIVIGGMAPSMSGSCLDLVG